MQAPSIPGTGDRSVPTLRLRQILRTYCWNLDPHGIADLRDSVESGRYPWLRSDLALAMAEPSATVEWWQESVGESGESAVTAQRDLWYRLFPDHAVPERPAADAVRDTGARSAAS